ncbi:peroxisomal carrier protein [Ascosphaera apis ARSEF 7405]|uniref:Peroxisomal carrier protein n=1 Tax=Ascosphaera apis ARSEF 7405 TaxID=392613 RepID=A0A167XBG9_9EURO|nr:peroxisomal carrier protein [Ascosphaera apis ARSEF 7405]
MGGQSKPIRLTPVQSAIAGSAGAVLANALVYPLDIVKTRLQVQVNHRDPSAAGPLPSDHVHYDNTVDAITKIVEQEGLSGLYSGMSSSLFGVASTNFAYFYWYTIVRTLYMKNSLLPKPPGTAMELSLGAVAGAIAQMFTIPVAVITTRQQTQPKGEKKGFFATGKEIIESEDGMSGLWRGLKASLVLVVNPAITYGVYQRLKDLLFPAKTNLKLHEAFILGALSKMCATVFTQPLIVAKVGLQSRPPPSRKGKPFKSFIEVMQYIIQHEGPLGLFKGIIPQILKGFLVQGLLMMTKEKIELSFILLLLNFRRIKEGQLRKKAQEVAGKVADGAKGSLVKGSQ